MALIDERRQKCEILPKLTNTQLPVANYGRSVGCNRADSLYFS